MPLPNDYKPRQGDVLVLHATVKRDFACSDDSIYLEADGCYTTLCLKPDQIAGVHSLLFEPGQRVCLTGDKCGRIIAVHGDQAWVEFDNHLAELVHVGNLARIEKTEKENAA